MILAVAALFIAGAVGIIYSAYRLTGSDNIAGRD